MYIFIFEERIPFSDEDTCVCTKIHIYINIHIYIRHLQGTDMSLAEFLREGPDVIWFSKYKYT